MVFDNWHLGVTFGFRRKNGCFANEDAKEEARSLINRDSKFEAYASDISPDALKNARSAISKAGMKDHVKLFERNALEISTEGRRGTIVCNPPYGERLGTLEEAEKQKQKNQKR